MYRIISYCRHLLLLLCLTGFTACITEDLPSNTRQGNFEALWAILDERYCFFDYKADAYGLDWIAVREHYRKAIRESMSDRQLFEVLANMIYELRDGHVNLYASHNVARYGAWFDDFPTNYSDSLERIYLGRAEDYEVTSGLKYKILDDHIGYVRCESFQNGFGDGNLHELLHKLAPCDGLILDIRNNGGGMLTAATKLASIFANKDYTGGYICHKTGKGHQDFSSPEAITIKPFVGFRWQKPAVILTNRRTYSAANSFVMFLKGKPNITVIGDQTGGGSGMPFSTELPNGWTLRFSACPMFDAQMQQTEMGILPDIKVDLTDTDFQKGKDTIIETARKHLRELTANP